MIPDIPWYITAVTIAVDATIAAAVWTILSRSAARAGLPPADRAKLRIGTGVFLATWLGTVLLLAPAAGSLAGQDPFAITPLIPLSFALAVTAVALALWRSPAFRRALGAATVPALIGVQAYRLIGAQFVILHAMGRLPGHFAIPAGWGDVAVGLAAVAALGTFPLILVPAFAVPVSVLLHLAALVKLVAGGRRAPHPVPPSLQPERLRQ
jgi:hypothetical protein